MPQILQLPVAPSIALSSGFPLETTGNVTYYATFSQLLSFIQSNIAISETQVTNLTNDLNARLQVALNLSDVASVPLSRNSLGLGGSAHQLPICETGNHWNFVTLTNGQLLIGVTGSDPVPATLTAGTSTSVTNAAGAITVDLNSTPVLGTPASGNLSNCNGYLVSTLSDVAYIDFSAGVGFTGFAANPTAITARYKLIGKTCFVNLNMTAGTSNATGFTITGMPAISAATTQYGSVGEATDNSAFTANASWFIGSGSTTLVLRLSANASGWTNVGSKGVNLSFSYETS